MAELIYTNLIERQTEKLVPEKLDKPASAIRIVLPEYPRAALDAGIEEDIVVRFSIEPDGSVQLKDTSSAKNAVLREAAEAAVKQWRFEPPMKDGKPTRIDVAAPLNFRIK